MTTWGGVFSFPPLTPLVKRILMVLLGAFVLELLLENWVGFPVYGLLALDTGRLGLSTLWQLGTYVLVWPLVPGSVLSFLITAVFLWWILAPFEMRFGKPLTIRLLAATALSAGLAALLLGLIFPQGARLSGCGSLLLGVIAAFAWSLRNRGMLSFFGVLPMKATTLIWVVLGFSVLRFLLDKVVVELAADLGAVGAGIGFIRWLERPPPRKRERKPPKRRPHPFQVIDGGGGEGDGDGRGDPPRWLN